VVTIEPAQLEGLTATLTMTVTDPDDDAIVARLWDFGDDSTAVDVGEAVQHSYDVAGTYLVRASATDAAGLTGRAERVLSVGEPASPITVRVLADPVAGFQPLTVRLEAEIEGDWEQLFWDFDDGATAGPGQETSLWHTFDGAGVYAVRARATAGASVGVGGVAVTVLGAEGGLPPKIVSTPGTEAVPGVAYHYDSDDTVDVTGSRDNLEFRLGKTVGDSKINRPDGMSVDGQGLIHWTPSKTQAGVQHKVSLVVSNAHGADFQDWTINVRGKREPVADDCGCGASPAGGSGGAVLMLLMLLAAIRRRRG
jgi:MYXO-CTERM domain-containing protein